MATPGDFLVNLIAGTVDGEDRNFVERIPEAMQEQDAGFLRDMIGNAANFPVMAAENRAFASANNLLTDVVIDNHNRRLDTQYQRQMNDFLNELMDGPDIEPTPDDLMFDEADRFTPGDNPAHDLDRPNRHTGRTRNNVIPKRNFMNRAMRDISKLKFGQTGRQTVRGIMRTANPVGFASEMLVGEWLKFLNRNPEEVRGSFDEPTEGARQSPTGA